MGGLWQRQLSRAVVFGLALLVYTVLAAPGHDVLRTYWVAGWTIGLPLCIGVFVVIDWVLSRKVQGSLGMLVVSGVLSLMVGVPLAWVLLRSFVEG